MYEDFQNIFTLWHDFPQTSPLIDWIGRFSKNKYLLIWQPLITHWIFEPSENLFFFFLSIGIFVPCKQSEGKVRFFMIIFFLVDISIQYLVKQFPQESRIDYYYILGCRHNDISIWLDMKNYSTCERKLQWKLNAFLKSVEKVPKNSRIQPNSRIQGF